MNLMRSSMRTWLVCVIAVLQLFQSFLKRFVHDARIVISLLCCWSGYGQGVFLFYNPDRPTLLSTGQVAGPQFGGRPL
jgi:hypothetical protein